MNRRQIIIAAGVGVVTASTFALKPHDKGAVHQDYFQRLCLAL